MNLRKLTAILTVLALMMSISSAFPCMAADAETPPNQAMADMANGDTPTPDVTTLYFNAYIPAVGEGSIADVKRMISIYSEEGGSPAGSGALWRCIREVGEFMGREVEMAGDYSGFTVTSEGETEFLKLTPEVQQKVIDKVKEGMGGIAVTATYEDGVFTFTKLGEIQFTYTVAGAAQNEADVTVATDGTDETEATDAETQDDEKPGGAVIYTVVAAVALIAIVLLIVFKTKYSKSNKKII
jgi:hypothetical protein